MFFFLRLPTDCIRNASSFGNTLLGNARYLHEKSTFLKYYRFIGPDHLQGGSNFSKHSLIFIINPAGLLGISEVVRGEPPLTRNPHYYENLTWIYTDISTEYCDDRGIIHYD